MPKTASSNPAKKKPSPAPTKPASARASSPRAAKASSRKSLPAAVSSAAETNGSEVALKKHQNGNGNGNGAHSKKSDRRNGAVPVIEISPADPAVAIARGTRLETPEAQ